MSFVNLVTPVYMPMIFYPPNAHPQTVYYPIKYTTYRFPMPFVNPPPPPAIL